MSHCTTQKRTGFELPTLAPTAFDDLLVCRRGATIFACPFFHTDDEQ